MAKRKGKSAQPSCRSKRARRASHSPPPAISQSGNSDFSGPLTPTDSRSISPHSPTHSVLPNVEAPFPPLATAAASSSQHGITADDRHSGATPAPALPPSTPSSSSAHANAPVPSANAARSPEGQLIKRTWTQYHAGHGGRSYIDSTLAKRMNTCRLKNAPDSATFSLDNLDFPLAFGPKQHGPDDCSKYVCLNKNPIKIWILGEIQAVVFKKEHLNARRAAVLINTFREEDRLRIKEIFTKFSQPPREPDTDEVWVGKWMAPRTCARDKIPAFEALVDICAGVHGQPKFPADLLKRFDIVSVEALITKYPNNYDSSNQWRASLELSRIFVLHTVDAARLKVDTVLF